MKAIIADNKPAAVMLTKGEEFIGCVVARMRNCPAGIARQKADLRQRLNVGNKALSL